MDTPVIYWFRQDLRLDDLPGLAYAVSTGKPVLPCYILDDDTPGHWRTGAASRWWLHHSLESLSKEIKQHGGPLILRRGKPIAELQQLAEESGATDIVCTRMYEPWAAQLESAVHSHFSETNINFRRYGGSLLHEPETISNQSGQPYKVFTPFWRQCLAGPEPPTPQPLASDVQWFKGNANSDRLTDWQLYPNNPDWTAGWEKLWQPGSSGAMDRLAIFLRQGIDDYDEGRNHPAKERTTRLSPHLHYGEISPRAVWHSARKTAAGNAALEREADKFLSELGWRDFSHHLLHHFPHMPEKPFKTVFDHFPWLADETLLRAWQKGLTGYPMVDAGMRELWQTGFMHNRVRMIAASFLTKHLLIHWRKGADWFWDTLLDADLANNSCGWQWVAGSGADASPYFRIFNPVAQGKKFDAKGIYIRRWVPELHALPNKHLHAPWEAPADVLSDAGVTLGSTYPHPVVDHKAARERALTAYAFLRQ